ncbi:co-chaperone GrpE [Clostridiales bacterium oral taxon 876 str. F0540]|nr:co-chaperone GrpE [Clostridiales bacterium oral taxon 876 str. F0540]
MENSNDVKYDAQEAEILEDQEFEGIDEEEIVSLEGLVEELQSSNKKLSDENKKLENELSAMKERIVRITAEYDNFRKRTAKEKEGIYTDACEDILKNMFPVLDNLERASNVNGSIEDIKKGIDMTIRQFNDSLSKLQVEEIPTDQGFDPNMHNAVMHVEDESFGEKAVVEVFQKGYKRGDKVLRYSMVKVAN